MSTLLNEAGAYFAAPVVYDSLGPQDVTVVDHDRDGHLDAVLAILCVEHSASGSKT